MRFRPCIDIHNGCVKQIVGGSLADQNDQALENFVSSQDAKYYADLYKKDNLYGGHIILLNPATSPYYKADLDQAYMALKAFPQGMMIGGGITKDNAMDFIKAGASHVIVTSYVFKDGQIQMDNLKAINSIVGKSHLVLDLSCKRRGDDYYVVTDRWQKFTELKLCNQTLDFLAPYCDEFLIHAVDVEGKASGIEAPLAKLLGQWKGLPMTYAGGISSQEDIQQLETLSQGYMDFTVGSALDLFGGPIAYKDLCVYRDK